MHPAPTRLARPAVSRRCVTDGPHARDIGLWYQPLAIAVSPPAGRTCQPRRVAVVVGWKVLSPRRPASGARQPRPRGGSPITTQPKRLYRVCIRSCRGGCNVAAAPAARAHRGKPRGGPIGIALQVRPLVLAGVTSPSVRKQGQRCTCTPCWGGGAGGDVTRRVLPSGEVSRFLSSPPPLHAIERIMMLSTRAADCWERPSAYHAYLSHSGHGRTTRGARSRSIPRALRRLGSPMTTSVS